MARFAHMSSTTAPFQPHKQYTHKDPATPGWCLGGRGLDLLGVVVHEGHDSLAVDAQVGNGLLALHLGAITVEEFRGIGNELAFTGAAVDEDELVEYEGDGGGQDGHVAAHGGLRLAPDAYLTGTGVEVCAGLGGGSEGGGGCANGNTAEHWE